MNAKADLAIWALDVLCRNAPAPLERGPANDAHSDIIRQYVGDPAVDQFKRECERLNKLPRATQPNPLDSCHDCGGMALHVTYRNGRAIGLCDDCY